MYSADRAACIGIMSGVGSVRNGDAFAMHYIRPFKWELARLDGSKLIQYNLRCAERWRRRRSFIMKPGRKRKTPDQLTNYLHFVVYRAEPAGLIMFAKAIL
ncbi:hypothetical protein Zmor_008148 [Zophobas morio]|uniref:Uncharacterized protein n=1 Tax=Zophobas morio TaxID=2755281 RepID=A0AA38IYD2_9CUCU|nr:hypothetical protein Zmor_008148 [Zophobas morio]